MNRNFPLGFLDWLWKILIELLLFNLHFGLWFSHCQSLELVQKFYQWFIWGHRKNQTVSNLWMPSNLSFMYSTFSKLSTSYEFAPEKCSQLEGVFQRVFFAPSLSSFRFFTWTHVQYQLDSLKSAIILIKFKKLFGR